MENDLLLKIINGEYKVKELDLDKINEVLNNDNIKAYLIISENAELKSIIKRILLELGIPSNLKGYTYITEAIFLCLQDNKYLDSITKYLYPNIAKEVNANSVQVEKNIRKAIEVGCTNANPELLEKVFGYSIGIDKDKPTNSNYIHTLTNILK